MQSALLRLKVRLQFTGWLQYLPTALIAAVLLLFAALLFLIGLSAVGTVFLVLGGVFAVLVLFDLVTVKLGIRPKEPLPEPRDDLDAFDLMRSRRSCRSFQSRELTEEHRQAVVDAADRWSHNKLGTSPIRFEYVQGELTVWPVVGAREYLVAIAPAEYSRTAVVDVGRNLQHVVNEATRMGLGTCWIGPGADHESIEAALGGRFDVTADHIICVCAIGYQSRYLPVFLRVMLQSQRHRLPLSDLFFADDSMAQPLLVEEDPFRRFGRTYEVCQWSPSSFNAQPTRAAAGWSGDLLTRFDFYASTPSRYYAPVALGIWLANWETGCEALGVPGTLQQVPDQQRQDQPHEGPPHYDMSWVLDSAIKTS